MKVALTLAVLVGCALVSWMLAFLPRRGALIYSTDGAFYESVARVIKRDRRFPQLNENYLLDVRAGVPNEHPLLLALLLSLLPGAGRKWLQLHGSGVLLGILASGAAAAVVSGGLGSALLAAGVVLATPMLVREAVGFNPRILGVVLVSASWVGYAALRPRHLLLAVVVSGVLVALVALTHRFALQAALLSATSVAILKRDVGLALAFVLGVGGALAVAPRHYPLVLRSHTALLSQHRRSRDLNVRSYAAYAGREVEAARPEWWRGVRLLGAGGATLLVTPWVAFSGVHDVAWAVGTGLVAAALVVALIPALRFLGEGERYLEFAAIPIATSLAGNKPSTALLAVLALSLGVSFVQYGKLYRTARAESSYALRPELLSALQRVKDEPERRVLSLPMWMGDFVVCVAEKEIFDARAHRTWEELPAYVPILRASVAEAVRDLAIEAAFVDIRVPLPQLEEVESLAEAVWQAGPYRYYRFR